MATYLSDTYPVEIWRGREINVLGRLAAKMMIVELAGETSGRTFFAEEKYIVDQPMAPKQTPRMFILEQLQAYETTLFDVWEGTATAEDLTEAIERMIDLYLGDKKK